MASTTTDLSVKQRLAVLFIYLVAAYLLNWWLTGRWVPSGGDGGLWFLSVVAFVGFALLSAPFFTRPVDAITSSIGAAFLLWSTSVPQTVVGYRLLDALRLSGIAYAVLVALLGALAVVTRDRPPANNYGIPKAAFRLSGRLGSPAGLFTFPAMVGTFGFVQNEPERLGVQAAAWIFLVTVRPVEVLVEAASTIWRGSTRTTGGDIVGSIDRVDSPNLLRVEVRERESWEKSPVLAAVLADGSRRWVLPLFTQVQEGRVVGTGLACDYEPKPEKLDTDGVVYRTAGSPDRGEVIKSLTKVDLAAELIGFVVEDSRIGDIRFEIAGDEVLQEGNLVFCGQGIDAVYYQILDAQTAEETFASNPRGTQIATASQLGTPKKGRGFVRFGWVPEMNTPVFLAKGETGPHDEGQDTAQDNDESPDPDAGIFQVGVVPGSNIPVLASIDELHTHHTAVLGMTGTGKTELALDIVRHSFARGHKVIVVDFTGEYRHRLADLGPVSIGLSSDESEELTDAVEAIEVGKYSAADEKAALTKLIDVIRPKVSTQVEEFLKDEGGAVAVIELPDIANTRASLRATELYLSTVFGWARRYRQARRVLLVLEEAHTVIPEMNVFGFDKGETQAVVARMGQIALQGRKYGVGLLLVSQRTALVSKTLLSQCNTVISFALVDKTSLEYLGNVFGGGHVTAITNLQRRQAVAHGVGILSERPIVVEIPYDEEKEKASDALKHTDEIPTTVESGPVEDGEETGPEISEGAVDEMTEEAEADPGWWEDL